MVIQHGPNIASEVASYLKEIEKYSTGPLHVLAVLPKLAAHKDIQTELTQLLSHPIFTIRLMAAEALARVGCSNGMRHIVYNALSTHPILNVSQTAGDKDLPRMARHALFPFVRVIPVDALDLLIEELKAQNGNPVHDLLASLPKVTIIPRVLGLRENSGETCLYSAYILARHGLAEGRSKLSQALKSTVLSELEIAIVGLSHIPTMEIVSCLEELADEGNSIYVQNAHLQWDIPGLAKHRVQIAKAILEHSVEDMQKILERLFMRAFQGTSLFSYGGRWVQDSFGMGSAPDLLFEFAGAQLRERLVTIQKKCLAFLDQDVLASKEFECSFALGLPHLNDIYNPPLRISIERDDFERAAIEWIAQPEAFLVGSCFSSYR